MPTQEDYSSAAELRILLRRFLHRSEQVARRHGLTPQQHQLLLVIKGAPDGSERATVSGLVELLQLTQSTVTELVQRAEEAGLLRREPSLDDGRVVHLVLTQDGEKRIAASVAELGEERQLLIELVSQLNDATASRRAGRSAARR